MTHPRPQPQHPGTRASKPARASKLARSPCRGERNGHSRLTLSSKGSSVAGRGISPALGGVGEGRVRWAWVRGVGERCG
eukprot:4698412-Alexandrium_andersonii.AAC.1